MNEYLKQSTRLKRESGERDDKSREQKSVVKQSRAIFLSHKISFPDNSIKLALAVQRQQLTATERKAIAFCR